ncbi:MAG TPA: hypothetical protein IGS53_07205 [Leptolyngbyaceae cyanobacterium M33_DOE_097]|uniref:Lipoprotein n=1 Tax=Oscillatoriales cyanobacterium SpSt-418 TaxID=2282169 RepID=A0A7C3PLU5_9CYAN|nr:hypothetical protein [Leptolyngbyaceae cyanobacterium M33_DOE_097]
MVRLPLKIFLTNILLFILIGCTECPTTNSPTTTPSDTTQAPPRKDLTSSVKLMTAQNPYLNSLVSKALFGVPWKEYDKYFLRQAVSKIEHQDGGLTKPDLTDGQWILSPTGQFAVAINASTGEPDNSLDIYQDPPNNKYVGRLDFCGPSCKYLGVYWISPSQFVLAQLVTDETSNEQQEEQLKLFCYNLDDQTVTTYISSRKNSVSVNNLPTFSH